MKETDTITSLQICKSRTCAKILNASLFILQSSFRKKIQKFQKLDSELSIKYENIGAKLSSYDKDYEDILMISMSSTTPGTYYSSIYLIK